MKKKPVLLALFALLIAVLFVACACREDPPEPVISVTADGESITLKEKEVENYNYALLFTIIKDGANVTVEKSFLDLSAVSATKDSFTVTCTYEGKTASITINVTHIVYSVELSQTEVTLRQGSVLNYDFKSLFVCKTDDAVVNITDQMVTSTVVDEIGEYTYTVTHGTDSKTLKVIVITAHEAVVVPSYKTLSITKAELANYDLTFLFSLYCDGVAVQVTNEMIDSASLANVEEGKTYTVYFSYTYEGLECTAEVDIAVVAEATLSVSTKNVETYPNGDYIDLTTLFEIRLGDEVIPVQNEMISGEIDYSKNGENVITLSYGGKEYTATVTVKRGVIINYASSNVITVRKGTDKSSYLFAEDFVVFVNGLRYRNIGQFVDSSSADFNTVGEYPVTIKIPYNEQTFGLSGAKFVYFEKTVTYKVCDVTYSVSLGNNVVSAPLGSESFNVFNNVILVRNGDSCGLTDNKDWVNRINCYAEVISEPIDLTKVGLQEVKIKLYPNYLNKDDELGEAVEVSYFVRVEGDVQIVANSTAVFNGATVFAKDLFTVTEENEEVEVTADMLSGKVDTFHAGVYTIVCEYKGKTASATVVVINSDIIGTYSTMQSPIPQNTDDDYDNENDDGYWGSDSEYYSLRSVSNNFGDMVITADGKITVHGKECKLLDAIDENTVNIHLGSNIHTLHFDNGIAVLDPDNSVKLGFYDEKRPLVYIKKDVWNIDNYIAVNYGDKSILETSFVGRDYNLYELSAISGEDHFWFALKTALVSKNGSDTVYEVSWGEATMADDFTQAAGVQSYFEFDGITEKFVMQDDTVAKLDKSEEEKLWANMSFNGTIDGKPAQLIFNSNEGVELRIDGVKALTAGNYEYSNYMKNGGVNHSENILFLYYCDGGYPLCSYKFKMDVATRKFTLLPIDGIFGKYTAENSYIFLDGYGTGIINFDTSSFASYQFTYTLVNNEVKIRFINTNVTFPYGKYMTFNMSELKNVLTTKYTENESCQGVTWKNQVVTDGALVNFSTTKFFIGKDSKQSFVNGIQIITKDGELTYEQKTAKVNGVSVVDTSCMDTAHAGFYQVKINLTVNGKAVQSLYSVQVFDKIHKDTPFAINGTSTVKENCRFSLDEYGFVRIVSEGVTYEGYAAMLKENSGFVGKAFASSGASVTFEGKPTDTSGVLWVRCNGATSFVDYFHCGESVVAGSENLVLRKITVNGANMYLLATTPFSLGNVVQTAADPTDSSVLVVTKADGTTIAVKAVFGTDATKGLTVADNLRGIYKAEGLDDLTIDGFGNAKCGSLIGAYKASGSSITVVSGETVKAYALDTKIGAYTVLNIALDETLVAGKSYSYSYNFVTDDAYPTTTTITFKTGGVAEIKSVSADYTAENGKYEPDFVGEGTYTVSGNKIILKISNKIFAFCIDNVIQCDLITLVSTTLSSDAVGYFGVGSIFVLAV